MEKEICIILPFFGRFNNYFNLWLKSCEYNNAIDWYIYTDDRTPYNFPDNVYVEYCDFSFIQNRIKKMFGSDIQLNTPYDLCKFRVAYHKIFSEMTQKYSYWGFCDCDLIWGDIYSAITPALKKGFDKISWRGHFTLFKNSYENRDLYLLETPNNTTFKDCISKHNNEINFFDEVGINRVFDNQGKDIYKDLLFADLKIKPYQFICNHFSKSEQYKNKHQIFEWNKGKLYRLYVYNNKIHKEEFIYIHFLRREMSNTIKKNDDHFLIVPNKFIDYQELTVSLIINFSRKRFYWQYYKKRLTPRYLFNFIAQKFKKEKKPDIYQFTIK